MHTGLARLWKKDYVEVTAAIEERTHTTDSIPVKTINALSDEDTANHVLKLWRDGEATDSSMKALMDEYGADQGGGLLYEMYDPDMYLKEIAAWCLDTTRQVGDVDILKTDYGYSIVYIVSLGNG